MYLKRLNDPKLDLIYFKVMKGKISYCFSIKTFIQISLYLLLSIKYNPKLYSDDAVLFITVQKPAENLALIKI